MTPGERERYSRQIRFPAIAEDGQARLLSSRAAIAGCGALGTVQAALLVRAGVGEVVLIDRDSVELSNLQRQTLFDERDAELGLPKAAAAAEHLRAVNSSCRITAAVADLTPANIDDLLEGCAVVLDGTDNFETRYLLNDWSVSRGVPWIYGAAVASYGLTMPLLPGRSACFACVYPSAPSGVQATCETAGVLGPVTAAIAALQAAAALKILAGGEPALRITTLDVWEGVTRQVAMPDPDPECRACGRRQFDSLDSLHAAPVSLCGRNAVQIHERRRPVDLQALGEQLGGLGEVRRNDFALRFFTRPYEITVFADGRAIVKGTTDPGVARSLYARYIGA